MRALQGGELRQLDREGQEDQLGVLGLVVNAVGQQDHQWNSNLEQGPIHRRMIGFVGVG